MKSMFRVSTCKTNMHLTAQTNSILAQNSSSSLLFFHNSTMYRGTFCLLWLSISLSNQLPQHNPGVYYLEFFFLACWWPNKHKKQFRKQNIVNIESHDMKLEVEEAKYGQLLCLHLSMLVNHVQFLKCCFPLINRECDYCMENMNIQCGGEY